MLGGHDRVVGGGEHGVHVVRDQRLRGENDLVHRGSGALDVGDALRVKVFLRGGDRRGGGILAHIVEQADLVRVRIRGENEVHDRVGVEVVGRAGDVRAGRLQRFDEARAQRVGHGGEHDGHVAALGGGLHRHGDRRRHADHQIDVVRLEVGDDLVHDIGVGVAVVLVDDEADALLRADGVKLRADVRDDLVEGRVVDEVADADGVGRARGIRAVGLSRRAGACAACAGGAAAAGGEGEREDERQCKRDGLFHGDTSFLVGDGFFV